MNMELRKLAVKLYPRTDYLDERAVRHARREWLKAVAHLRMGGKWVKDLHVPRLQ